MALRNVVETELNEIVLKAWPHLHDGQIEDGYTLGFESKMTAEGSIPTYPTIDLKTGQDSAGAIYDTVSPPKWDGISEVIYQGDIVYQPRVPRSNPIPPKIDDFQKRLEQSQNSAQSDEIVKYIADQQHRAKMVLFKKIGIGVVVIGVLISGLVYLSAR